MARIIQLSGLRFGKLSVLKRSENTIHGKAKWLCLCDCGVEKSVIGSKLLNGEARSCGCNAAEAIKAAKTKHGMSYSRTYNIWHGIKARCLNPKNPSYKRYGGAGISICEEWKNSFEAFLSDVGEAPIGKSLDRIDGAKNYSPENCRWATPPEQSENSKRPRIITFRGSTMNMTNWAKSLGITQPTLHERINKWGLTKALSVGKTHKHKHYPKIDA